MIDKQPSATSPGGTKSKRELRRLVDYFTFCEISMEVFVLAKNEYRIIKQGPVTNQFAKVATVPGMIRTDAITGMQSIQMGDLTVRLGGHDHGRVIRTQTHQLLDYLVMQWSADGGASDTLSIRVSDYVAAAGRGNHDNVRVQMEQDIRSLTQLQLVVDGKYPGVKPGKAVKGIVNVIDSVVWGHGRVDVRLGGTFAAMMRAYPVMPYPSMCYRIDSRRNVHSYYFLRLLSAHKRKNIGKPNADRVSVATLLASSPHMPSENVVRRGDRKYMARRIEPMERDMDALADVLVWHYCRQNGAVLSDDELGGLDYYGYMDLLVQVTWHNYPDYAELIAARKTHAGKAQKGGGKA